LTRRLWVLMAIFGADMFGTMIVVPLLPFYATRFGASPALYGVLYACYPFAQLATAPLWGRLSDRYGRRPMILAGLTASALAYLAFGLADTLPVLFLMRLLQGVGGGIVGVVQAYVTDSVPAPDRTQALGWLTVATNIGVTLGAAAGSLSRNLGPHAPGLVAATLCFVNIAVGFLWLSEPPPHEEPAGAPAPAARRSVRRSIYEVLRHPLAPVSSLVWIYAVGMMAFFAMNSIFGLYLGDLFGVTENTIGYFFVYVGGLNVVMRAFLLGPAVRRFGEVGALRLGALALIAGLLLLPLMKNLPLLALAVVLVPVGTALLFPATTALVSRLVPRREVGQALGVQQSFGGVSKMVGPLGAGLAYGLDPRYPFWIAAILMGGVSILTRQVREEPTRQPAVPAEAAAAEAAASKGL
jgi:MFS family permease